ncbi:MAG: M3 family oligoendopeptidase [Armatimonadetes bacterium]|nr:M3 family oligoendopeptidase [Anaerolineae bacterium]
MVTAAAERLTGAEHITWDLSIFYTSSEDPAIQADLGKLQTMANDLAAQYKGRIASLTADEMGTFLEALIAIYDLGGRLDTYSGLQFTVDTVNPQFGALMQKVREAGALLQQTIVFFELEWAAVSDDAALVLLNAPRLAKYRHYLEAQRRFKPHQLSELEERLLIEQDVTGRSAWVRFFTQLTGAMRYEYNGEKLNQSQIVNKLYQPDRAVRQQAADSLTAGLRERGMELTYIFNVLAAEKAAGDARRSYATWITARNLENKAPDAVVQALVDTVTGSYDLVARHYKLKRALLGVDELYDYDRYAPLDLGAGETFYTWDEAKTLVLSAFHAFSPLMGEIAQKFFDERWIHAPVLPNKRGGAFCSPSVPSAHPFVLVNFMGRPRDVMTLAHELGHGLHMYFSSEAQGLLGLYTPLTTAEMASVFAEMMVFQALTRTQTNSPTKLAMLAEKVEDTIATVFRQTSMNRFEDQLHTARRTEGELSTERISQMWLETQRAMFGDSVTLREAYGLWWGYIPHFLATPGYVYAYAFGELLVLALFQLYQERGAAFVPQYLDVLAAGDSDYPDKILAKVGLDLNDPAFWGKGIAALRVLIDQEEALARELFPAKFA